MIRVVRWLLLPFSLIYQSIVWTRNLCYDKGWFTSHSFQIPTIVIGNLAVGGTGKSPMVEYLIRLLKNDYKIATLSRGYGRKTKGYRESTIYSTALEVGDEPRQFKMKYPNITVAVSEDRCTGVNILQHDHDLILLDDAYQHRKLTPGYAILLFDFNSLFKNRLTLPTGDFRDIFSSTKRANLIIITKCPETIYPEQKEHIEHLIRKYNPCPIFYTTIVYDKPRKWEGSPLDAKLGDLDILLFSGIANPKPLEEYLQKEAKSLLSIPFPDHHNYSTNDFVRIKNQFVQLESTNKIILTTEKDMQRILLDSFEDLPLFYIPIHLKSLDHQRETFDHFIENYLKSYK